MDWFNGVKEFFADFANSIIDVLPKSPIVYLTINTRVREVMGYVNFFIPIYSMISIVEGWLVAIGVYYVASVILRWLKLTD